jgi:hypothetical protein
VKLFGYGLGRMTDYGRLVAFPIGDPRLTAPEVLLSIYCVKTVLSQEMDLAFDDMYG